MFKITFSWICFAAICAIAYAYDFDYLQDVKSRKQNPDPTINCDNFPQELKNEVAGYKEIANRIINEAVSGSFKGKVYEELATFADRFGHRLVGSQALEDSIDYLVASMAANGFPSHKEEIPTPVWRRISENLRMVEPIEEILPILSLGFSVGTPVGGIEAEVLVVTSFEELAEKADQARGKIVVFNQEYTSYADGHKYRGSAASEVAKIGGVAALVRSITPFSMNTLHTGMMVYEDGVAKIPCAAITIETAEKLSRIAKRDQRIILHMETVTESEDGFSHNAIGTFTGATIPDEIVIVSGHIDSWDVGQGVMDDAAGVFVSTEVLNLLKALDLKPKRTIQAIGWTSEELGIYGAIGFMETHKDEIGKYVTAFESDTGTFKPMGLDYSGSDVGACVVKEILKLLEPINATNFRRYPMVGTDVSLLEELGVPGLSIANDGFETDEYFWYHHSDADTMTVLDSSELDLCLALWSVSSYIVADLSVALTKLPEMPPVTTEVSTSGTPTTDGSTGSSTTGGSTGSSTTGGSTGSSTTEGSTGSSTTGGSTGSSTTGGSGTSTTTEASSGNLVINVELVILCIIFVLRKIINH